ncbi:hypothetical protein KBD45_02185 [Candidatus Dojkabacteria bacterium]|nr:hypothetical protein [Candidatus Dojkabacteria bacterium]
MVRKIPLLIFWILLLLIIYLIVLLPLSLLSILITLLITISGVILPFINIKATWWCYTLGGKLPLPKENLWLSQKQIKTNNLMNDPYKKFIRKIQNQSYSLIPLLIAFVNILINYQKIQLLLLILKILSSLSIFGLSLTLGTALRKKYKLTLKFNSMPIQT